LEVRRGEQRNKEKNGKEEVRPQKKKKGGGKTRSFSYSKNRDRRKRSTLSKNKSTSKETLFPLRQDRLSWVPLNYRDSPTLMLMIKVQVRVLVYESLNERGASLEWAH